MYVLNAAKARWCGKGVPAVGAPSCCSGVGEPRKKDLRHCPIHGQNKIVQPVVSNARAVSVSGSECVCACNLRRGFSGIMPTTAHSWEKPWHAHGWLTPPLWAWFVVLSIVLPTTTAAAVAPAVCGLLPRRAAHSDLKAGQEPAPRQDEAPDEWLWPGGVASHPADPIPPSCWTVSRW